MSVATHDPRVRAAPQQGQERERDLPRAEEVGVHRGPRHGQVGAGGELSRVVVDRGVVDEHVQAPETLAHLGRRGSGALPVGHVEADRMNLDPSPANRPAASAADRSERAVSTTTWPSRANCRQVSKPMPRLAPVTKDTGAGEEAPPAGTARLGISESIPGERGAFVLVLRSPPSVTS